VPRVIPVGKDRVQKRMQPHGVKAKGRFQLKSNMGSAS
jgi:hypothetical protein